MNATLTNVSVLCTASKRTLLQWLTMRADHPAITLVNFFLENYLKAVYTYLIVQYPPPAWCACGRST